jgi:small subunit ribosomal protein S2
VIPSNDDAIRAIKLLVGRIADAVVEGKAMRKDVTEEEIQPAGVSMQDVEEEPELSDEELLGAATLAKISSSMGPSDEAEEVEAEVEAEEEIEEEVEEDIESEEEDSDEDSEYDYDDEAEDDLDEIEEIDDDLFEDEE